MLKIKKTNIKQCSYMYPYCMAKKINHKQTVKLGIEKIGTFEATSGTFYLTDPCYAPPSEQTIKDKLHSGKLHNVKKGTWASYIRFIKINEIATLFVFHESIKENDIANIEWKLMDFKLSVNSAQIGIFDENDFRNNDVTYGRIIEDYKPTTKPGGKWYGMIAHVTSTQNNSGCVPGGVAINSGWPRGYDNDKYLAYYVENKQGERVGIKVVIISPEIPIEMNEDDEEWAQIRAQPRPYMPLSDTDSNPEQIMMTTKLNKAKRMTKRASDKFVEPPKQYTKKELKEFFKRALYDQLNVTFQRWCQSYDGFDNISTYIPNKTTKKHIQTDDAYGYNNDGVIQKDLSVQERLMI